MTVQTPEPGPAPDFAVKENGLDAPSRFRTPARPRRSPSRSTRRTAWRARRSSMPRPRPRGSSSRFQPLTSWPSTASAPSPTWARRSRPTRSRPPPRLTQLGTGGDPGHGDLRLRPDGGAGSRQGACRQEAVLIVLSDGASQNDTASARGRDRGGQGRTRDRLRRLDRRQCDGAAQLRQLTDPTGGADGRRRRHVGPRRRLPEDRRQPRLDVHLHVRAAWPRRGPKINLEVSAPGMGPGTTSTFTVPGKPGSGLVRRRPGREAPDEPRRPRDDRRRRSAVRPAGLPRDAVVEARRLGHEADRAVHRAEAQGRRGDGLRPGRRSRCCTSSTSRPRRSSARSTTGSA